MPRKRIFSEEIFKSANSDQILANSAFQLAAKVCQQIAIDERMELCDFAEKILPNIVFLEGREEKYVLFLILIEAHSPNGMTFNDPGFYARNPKEWRNILENMFSMIMQESRAEILSQPFIHFATAGKMDIKLYFFREIKLKLCGMSR